MTGVNKNSEIINYSNYIKLKLMIDFNIHTKK